jgi:type II pantothenate kinase
MLEAAIDFGGTLTKVIVASGEDETRRTCPGMPNPDEASIAGLLREAGCASPQELDFLAVTGGRSARLALSWDDVSVVAIDEAEATASGGLLGGAVAPAIVVSIGTGTGIVLAREDGTFERLLGSGIGGGTVVGLARLLVGDQSIARYGALAASGSLDRCDLTVGDILGSGTGPVPADATAAHFGRIGLAGMPVARREDQMAAIVGMVVQNAVRLAISEMTSHGASSLILLGGFLAEPGFRSVIDAHPMLQRFPVPIAEPPEYAVVRGALEAARRLRASP